MREYDTGGCAGRKNEDFENGFVTSVTGTFPGLHSFYLPPGRVVTLVLDFLSRKDIDICMATKIGM